MPIDAALLPPHGGPLGPTPPRAPWSVRRTSTIDTTWPEGMGQPMRAEAHARDLLTGADPARPTVLAADSYLATVTQQRAIAAIASKPSRAGIEQLVGSRAGSQLRGHIAEVLPDDLRRGTPLYLLLDDLAGASLVANWAWSHWDEDWFQRLHTSTAATLADRRAAMAGICVGFSPDGPPCSSRTTNPISTGPCSRSTTAAIRSAGTISPRQRRRSPTARLPAAPGA